MSKPWRVRLCPACRRGLYGGELITLDLGARWGWDEPARRQCIHCGHIAVTPDFPVVREVHTGSEVTHGSD